METEGVRLCHVTLTATYLDAPHATWRLAVHPCSELLDPSSKLAATDQISEEVSRKKQLRSWWTDCCWAASSMPFLP